MSYNDPDSEIEQIIEIDFVTYKKDSILIEESQQLKFALKRQKVTSNQFRVTKFPAQLLEIELELKLNVK
jgi:hypothetical protein